MKKIIIAVGVLMMLAAAAPAAPYPSLGGRIYWQDYVWRSVLSQQGYIDNVIVKYVELDSSYNFLGQTDTRSGDANNASNVVQNLVTIPFVQNSEKYTTHSRGNLEVLDPRHEGGTGQLIALSVTDQIPGGGTEDTANVPWDILKVSGTDGSWTKICDGRLNDGNWHTVKPSSSLLVAPDDWFGYTSNGLSLVGTMQGPTWVGMYDVNNSGMIDNTLSEGQKPAFTAGSEPGDLEFGDDGALYSTHRYTGGSNGYSDQGIRRHWVDGSGTARNELYYHMNGGAFNNVWLGWNDFMGLAIAPSKDQQYTAPIVYVCGKDVENNLLTIFALQDLDGDNVITGTDRCVEVFTGGEFYRGYTELMWQSAHFNDLEYDPISNTLLANNSWGTMLAIHLTADGLDADNASVVIGYYKTWTTPGGPGPTRGFEIDMIAPAAEIPEPATLLLAGTGVLCVVGYVRRRRMT